MTDTEIEDRYHELYDDWANANSEVEDEPEPTEQMILDEQRTWEVLVDFVDEHGLTYTDLDPRGPAEPA